MNPSSAQAPGAGNRGTILATLAVGLFAAWMLLASARAEASPYAYVLNPASYSVVVVDLASDSVVETRAGRRASRPEGVPAPDSKAVAGGRRQPASED